MSNEKQDIERAREKVRAVGRNLPPPSLLILLVALVAAPLVGFVISIEGALVALLVALAASIWLLEGVGRQHSGHQREIRRLMVGFGVLAVLCAVMLVLRM